MRTEWPNNRDLQARVPAQSRGESHARAPRHGRKPRETPMKHGTWFNLFAAEGRALDLPAQTRDALAKLDEKLFSLWNLGDNVLLCWTHADGELLFLSV